MRQPFADLRAAFGRLMRDPRALTALLIVVWAIELFCVQEATLHEQHYYASYQPILHRAVRLALNLLTCGMLVTLLPRLALAIFLTAGLLFSGVVLAFENYSGHPLSATMITANAGEGASVSNAGVALLPSWFFLLALVLVFKLVLLHRIGHLPLVSRRQRWSRLARMALSYLVLIAALNVYKPFTLLLGWESVGGLGSLYGYAPTWAAELLLLDSDEILQRAKERVATRSNQLVEAGEGEFPASQRLVFLQVESLDAATLAHEAKGQPVAPVLRALAETSMSYSIRSEKKTGSCDADFTSLMGGLPSVDMPNYKIPGFAFDESFVGELRALGFRTSAVHNVKGAFFNRREAFQAMAFDRLFFLEELKGDEHLPFESWAVLDRDMLNWAAADLSRSTGKQFDLIITATSHVPFHYTPSAERLLYPGNDDMVASYLDAIHYVDSAIGDFVKRLPAGTILVIYGDHGAFLKSEEYGYQNAEYQGVPLVPFLIHQVGGDIHALQRTRAQELASSGQLTLLDMMSYVHAVVRRQNESASGPQSPRRL